MSNAVSLIEKVTPSYAGEILATEVTATTAGASNIIAVLTDDVAMVEIVNTLNADTYLTYSDAQIRFLPAGQSVIWDLRSNNLGLRGSLNTIGVYHLGVAPSSGRIGITTWKARIS